MPRKGQITRETAETKISADLELDGKGQSSISTGLPFMEHMLEAFTAHAGFDLNLQAKGDLEVDSHHLMEDVGLVLGQSFCQSVGEKRGIRRFGSALVPMDDVLVRVAVDISGRPYLGYHSMPQAGVVGNVKAILFREFFQAFTNNAGVTMHADLLHGAELHHVFEALFKAAGRGISQGVQTEGASQVPSTKGSLD